MKRNILTGTKYAYLLILAVLISSCEKELTKSETFNLKENNVDQIVTNEDYGNWLKFDNLTEYKNFINDLKSRFENSNEGLDSVLDLEELSLGYISLRHHYNDETIFDDPTNADTICFAPSILASVANEHGIYQIEDTIYRLTKHNVFKITNADASLLYSIEPFINEEEVDPNSLPENVSRIKLYDGNTPIETVLANGGGYSVRFTIEDKKEINGEVFKLVATFSLYAMDHYSEYYTRSRFEKKVRKNSWKQEWATPLTLSSNTTFVISNTPYSNGTKRIVNSQSKDGKRDDIYDWYWWDPNNPDLTGIDIMGHHSIHTAKRTGELFSINIYY